MRGALGNLIYPAESDGIRLSQTEKVKELAGIAMDKTDAQNRMLNPKTAALIGATEKE